MERDDGSKEPPAFISAIEWPRIPAEYLKMWVVDQQTSTKKELVGYECSCVRSKENRKEQKYDKGKNN